MIHTIAKRVFLPNAGLRFTHLLGRRSFSGFSFVGPKTLDEILQLDKVAGKSGNEIAEIWYEFHDGKQGMLGIVTKGQEGKAVLERARECPFFIQPVFRDDGFFILVSQYMDPSHFCMAYLEDYKMDPHSATPLLTFSIFNDLADSKNISLVRCDILNKSIADNEGMKIVSSTLQNYKQDFNSIKTFNTDSQHFDVDDFISRMSSQWRQAEGLSGAFVDEK